jgi:hypothetical protein
MNDELSEGMTDGSYKKVVQNRGGLVDPGTYEARKDLHDRWYGIHEQSNKILPDTLNTRTPNFVSTPEADCC